MNEVIDQTAAPPSTQTPAPAPDLATAVQRVLAASDEPLTVSKLRARLPAALRTMDLKELTEALERQVAASALYKYPKYRSQQDRYWDRGMTIHIACLLRMTLEADPLAWSELRRKLPAYAQAQAQEVLDQQLAQGLLHRHPRTSSRSGDRFGVRPPDPKDYLRQALPDLFASLTALGFTRPQIRAAALELLHEEEWDVEPPQEAPSADASPAAPQVPPVAQTEFHANKPDAVGFEPRTA